VVLLPCRPASVDQKTFPMAESLENKVRVRHRTRRQGCRKILGCCHPIADGLPTRKPSETSSSPLASEQRLADLRAMYEDMKAQRDRWEGVAIRLSLTEQKPPMTWWRWLRTTG
jgi:hypothetical protein